MDLSPGTAVGQSHPAPPAAGRLGRGDAAVGTRCVPLLVPGCHPSLGAGVRGEVQELRDTLQAVLRTKGATISKICCYFCVLNGSQT